MICLELGRAESSDYSGCVCVCQVVYLCVTNLSNSKIGSDLNPLSTFASGSKVLVAFLHKQVSSYAALAVYCRFLDAVAFESFEDRRTDRSKKSALRPAIES